jgi:MFS family permease
VDHRRNRSRDKHSRRDTVNRKAGVLAAVYVAVLSINLDVTIVNVGLPSIATELHADTRGLQWVVDGYNLTFAALVLAAGSLADRYGRRPALLIGLLGFAVTGGLLLEHFSWSSVFWALVPLALLAAVLTYFLVPESRDPDVPALDIRGLTTSIALLGVLVYTIIEAPARGWSSTATLFGFAAAAALALAFVTIEQAAEHPMLDVRLFTDRRFSAASASVTVTFFSLSGLIFLITQYFQVLRGFSPLATGARTCPSHSRSRSAP